MMGSLRATPIFLGLLAAFFWCAEGAPQHIGPNTTWKPPTTRRPPPPTPTHDISKSKCERRIPKRTWTCAEETGPRTCCVKGHAKPSTGTQGVRLLKTRCEHHGRTWSCQEEQGPKTCCIATAKPPATSGHAKPSTGTQSVRLLKARCEHYGRTWSCQEEQRPKTCCIATAKPPTTSGHAKPSTGTQGVRLLKTRCEHYGRTWSCQEEQGPKTCCIATAKPPTTSEEDRSKNWPKTGDYVHIPYEYPSDVDSKTREDIAWAVQQFESSTCIRLTNVATCSGETNCIYIDTHGRGCASHIGMQGGKQQLHHNPATCEKGNLIHNIMHVLGFIHEHSRKDRDAYINVNWEKIEDRWERNFRRCDEVLDGYCTPTNTPYDFESIMHYGPSLGDVEVMTAKGGNTIRKQRDYLTAYDVEDINYLYSCN